MLLTVLSYVFLYIVGIFVSSLIPAGYWLFNKRGPYTQTEAQVVLIGVLLWPTTFIFVCIHAFMMIIFMARSKDD